MRIAEKIDKLNHELFNSDLAVKQKVQGYNSISIPVLNYIANNMLGNTKFESTLNQIKKVFKDKLIKSLHKSKIRQQNNLRDRLFLPHEKGGLGIKDPLLEYKISHITTALYLIFRNDLRGIAQNLLSWTINGKQTIFKDMIHILNEVFPGINIKDMKIQYIDDEKTQLSFKNMIWDDMNIALDEVKNLLSNHHYENIIKEIGIKNTWGKLQQSIPDIQYPIFKSNIKNEMMRTYFAISENQVLLRTHPTNAKHGKSQLCRSCKKHPETLTHVLTSCENILSTFGKERHDLVTRIIWRELIKKFKFKYVPGVKIYENEDYKLLWDFKHEIEEKLYHTKPDITIIDKKNNSIMLIETSISMTDLMTTQKRIKEIRYTINGEIEITHENYKKVTHGKNLKDALLKSGFYDVKFIPLIVSTSGELLKETKMALIEYLAGKNAEKGFNTYGPKLSSNALAVSHRILRRLFGKTGSDKHTNTKGSIGHPFRVCIRTENHDQANFCPFTLQEVSVLFEFALGHLRYSLIDVPPQSNSPPDMVIDVDY
uniref:Reverse transcriptase domain-containing protein n=1 Tax=Strongyloides papillosus TaxID=174720 RepID=A0A0N5BJJ5_STREA